MDYHNSSVAEAARVLKSRLSGMEDKLAILKSAELKALYARIPGLPPDERRQFGSEVNALRDELTRLVERDQDASDCGQLPAIDVTAPFDLNTAHPSGRLPLLDPAFGSTHPLMSELETILDIFYRMGFTAVESPELDDDYHMFGSLNFAEDHPARDDYDTFMTTQTNHQGRQLIAPAHTSTMQNRVLRRYKDGLEQGRPVAAVIPGRVFRNEDLDARHEHTFYQLEGVYVDRGIHVGHLIATLKTFLEAYYGRKLEVRTQPFYFPFTEPSFEFSLSCPFCDSRGCNICSQTGWIEMLGCGLIHPNVLREADIDPDQFTGFAWGGGIERLVMMKYGVEDIRHFESGRLDFLRQFA